MVYTSGRFFYVILTMPAIKDSDIQLLYRNILVETQALVSPEQWHIEPRGLQYTNHKTKYGMADIHGMVHINQKFIGSQANQLLDATIRHELAHLCVGLDQGHGARFKRCATLFKADMKADMAHEKAEIHTAIGHKYLLYAKLENQGELLFRKAHRKHPKYSRYKPKRFSYLTIGGHKVLGFRYELI